MGLLDDFIRGTRVLGDLYNGDQTAALAGQPLDPGLGSVAAGLTQGAGQFIGDALSAPRRMVRGAVGLDPNGKASDDLQQLGMPRVPSAWLGSFTDTMADPLMAAGALSRGASRVASSPAVRSFMANESGTFTIPEIYKLSGRAIPPTESRLQVEYLTDLWKNAARPATDLETDAAKMWSGSASEYMSALLRNEQLKPSTLAFMNQTYGSEEEIRAAIERLRNLTNRTLAPADSILYRKVGSMPAQGNAPRGPGLMGELNAADPEAMIGKIITEPSFTATSLSPNDFMYAKPGPNDMLVDIVHPEGVPGHPLFTQPGQFTRAAEREILLPPGMKYKVLGVKQVPYAERWNHPAGIGPNVLLEALKP